MEGEDWFQEAILPHRPLQMLANDERRQEDDELVLNVGDVLNLDVWNELIGNDKGCRNATLKGGNHCGVYPDFKVRIKPAFAKVEQLPD